MKHLFKKKLKYVSKNFHTNLKIERIKVNVFFQKEVFVTLSLELKRNTPSKVFLKDFDTRFKGIFLKTHLWEYFFSTTNFSGCLWRPVFRKCETVTCSCIAEVTSQNRFLSKVNAFKKLNWTFTNTKLFPHNSVTCTDCTTVYIIVLHVKMHVCKIMSKTLN